MRKPGSLQVLLVTASAALVWAVILGAIASLRFGGDLRGFLFLGSGFPHPAALADAPRYGTSGYDGQFYSALATDPLMLRAETEGFLDSPRYRSLHVIVPLAAWVLGFAQDSLAIRAYQVLVLGAGAGGDLPGRGLAAGARSIPVVGAAARAQRRRRRPR